jgi:serine/threonine-protein kinase RsbW
VTYVERDRSTPDRGTRPAHSAREDPSRERPVLAMELRTVASTNVIPTIRTVAADLAARADFDLDAIDDLRMAVDDLCAMVVRIAVDKAGLRCAFTVRPERIEVDVEIDIADPLPTGSFGWRVLECLTDGVSVLSVPAGSEGHDRVCITVVKQAVRAQRL